MQNAPFTPRITIATLALTMLTACSSTADEKTYAPGERIGTYDGRAVAIAYAGSDLFGDWMKKHRTKHDDAKASGDDDTVQAIVAMMKKQQETFHGQAFRGEDIDDILALIPADVHKIGEKAKVARLEQVNKDRPSSVETVDVTDQLIALFEPDEKTRRWVDDIRKKPFPNR